MQGRLFHYPALAYFTTAHFELGFDERHDAAGRAQQRHDRWQDLCRRYECYIDRGEVELWAKVCRLQVPRVDAFAQLDARIVSQSPVELVVADINCQHPARAVLQKAVGEPAG